MICSPADGGDASPITDGDHYLPIFPNLAKNIIPDGPNKLWEADITYVAIAINFV